jgi:FecR protein
MAIMSGKRVLAVVAILVCAGLPGAAAGQSEESAGVVTTVNGNATLTRAAKRAQPVALRMRDEIFVRDRIHTQEQSLVRVLLGGKALITVRELSVLTITEEANRVTVDLQSGKVGVAVVKGRMRPGEVIEIRSPNAMASVRGTVFVVDVDPIPAGRAVTAAATTTRIHLFQGALDISTRLDAAKPIVKLAQMQSIVVAGKSLGTVSPLTREQVAAVTADLKPRQVQESEAATAKDLTGQIIAREQGRAIALASTLLPPVPGGPGGINGPNLVKNVKGTAGNTVKGVTGSVANLTTGLTDGLGGTVTNVTGNAAETLERLMDSLGLANVPLVGAAPEVVDELGQTIGGTVGDVGKTLGKTVGGLGNGLGNVLGGGSSPSGPVGGTTSPAAPPMAAPPAIAPPIAAPPIAAPPIAPPPVAPPPVAPAPPPLLAPIIRPVLGTLGGLLGR